MPHKKEFSVIDLGNNVSRFGFWDDPIDWLHIFRYPEIHLQNIRSDEEIELGFRYEMPDDLRAHFPKSAEIDFDVRAEHDEALRRLQANAACSPELNAVVMIRVGTEGQP